MSKPTVTDRERIDRLEAQVHMLLRSHACVRATANGRLHLLVNNRETLCGSHAWFSYRPAGWADKHARCAKCERIADRIGWRPDADR
jgi:hypothetical protein